MKGKNAPVSSWDLCCMQPLSFVFLSFFWIQVPKRYKNVHVTTDRRIVVVTQFSPVEFNQFEFIQRNNMGFY